jgi:hypothetical protein
MKVNAIFRQDKTICEQNCIHATMYKLFSVKHHKGNTFQLKVVIIFCRVQNISQINIFLIL